MAEYPVRGQKAPTYWDDQLKAYIDDSIEEAAYAAAGGVELGYSSRVGNFATTATVNTDPAGTIPSLSLSFQGTGRPVDLRFSAPSGYHSVANTLVNAAFIFDGSLVSTVGGQVGATRSSATNNGPSFTFSRRTDPLVLGQTYTVGVRVWSGAAGTATLVGASFVPIELSAVSR